MSSPLEEISEKAPVQSQPLCSPNLKTPDYGADDELDLFKCWNIIWGGRNFILLFAGGCTLLAVLVTLFVLPVIFRSESVLQPVSIEQNSLSKLNSLAGGLSSELGIGSGEGSNQRLVDFLSSRNLKQRLLEKYDLLPKLYADDWDAEQEKWKDPDPLEQPSLVKALQTKRLQDIFSVDMDKSTSLITIAWEDEDPHFAALMLERVIEELKHYLKFEYETDAKRERVFTEEQLQKTKHELEFWERQIPGPKLTQGEIQRELIASQLVYQELRKQLELAKIQEAKQVVSFKVLDPPFVPELKYKPKRSVICALTLMASGFMAVFMVVIWRNFQERKAAEGDREF